MERDAIVLIIRAVLGGSMVTGFAVVGHILRPKWFAGLFSAAPAVAIASLAVTVVAQGRHDAAVAGSAMIFGAAGFVAYCLCVRPLLMKTPAVVASSIGCIAWALVAIGGYGLVVGF